jgi:hypothetical protein
LKTALDRYIVSIEMEKIMEQLLAEMKAGHEEMMAEMKVQIGCLPCQDKLTMRSVWLQ